MQTGYLPGVCKQFEYYKMLGDKTMEQVPAEKISWQFNDESNSIATIVKHLWGNMMSRFTDFGNSDGEKNWRDRDAEFENDILSKEEVIAKWNEAWKCFFDAFDKLTEDDLGKIVYIRNMGHTVLEAMNRHLAHASYHIGQIVFLGKMICNTDWHSLSIPKGASKKFNEDKFAKPKHSEHFAEEFINTNKSSAKEKNQ